MNKQIKVLKDKMDILIAIAAISIVLMIIIPLPTFLLDLLIALNITLSAIIFITTLFTTNVLQLSIFPTLLLITTLFRVALNVSSTRLILSEGNAGSIIEAFGQFVISGNYVVGIIIFLIIVVIQFVVITNGAGRVSEVTARFTLDALPGKQMSIDADLNSGLITEEIAKQRRTDLQKEADFYGAMDGASKFVKGDAIAGIIITIINIIGGIIIGMTQLGFTIGEAAELFVRLTVGDGLVSQVPALLISVASGILVTRSGSSDNFGKTFTSQLSNYPIASAIAAAIMFILFIVPGMPKLPFLTSAIAMGILSYILYKEESKKAEVALSSEEESIIIDNNESENVMNLVSVEPLEIEIGYSLIPLADENVGGDLLNRIASVRRQCAIDMGIVLQPIRIRDNLTLKNNEYAIKIRGIVVATYELIPNMLLCMNPMEDNMDIVGIPATEPSFNLPALWINENQREEAELRGLTIVDSTTVLITHLTEIIKRHSYELLGRQEVKLIIDNMREKYSAVIEELIPDILSIGEVQKVLQNLLKEKVSIKDTVTILETLADNARTIRDLELLTEYVRISLSRNICNSLIENRTISVVTLSQNIEELIANNISKTPTGSILTIDPEIGRNLMNLIKNKLENITFYNEQPVILVSPNIRCAFKKFLDLIFDNIMVISLNETPNDIELNIKGVVDFEN